MKVVQFAGLAAVALVTAAPSAYAQTPTQRSGDAAATQTFTGCLMKETDYRRAHNLGGGAAGGVGLGDEFVLVNVDVSPAKASAAAAPSSTAPAANTQASPAACVDQGTAYRVTGTAEERLKNLVGHHLEIQGRFKHADDVSANAAGAAGALPAEVEIVSFREAPAAAAGESPAPAPAAPVTRPDTPRATAPATDTDRAALPSTASATPLVIAAGVLALLASVALGLVRRRLA